MNRHNRQPSRRKIPDSNPKPRSHRKSTRGELRRKTVLWSGGLMTAVLTGVLISALGPQAERVLPPPASPAIKPIDEPVTFVWDDLNFFDGFTYFFSKPIVWSSGQLPGVYNRITSTENSHPSYLSSLGGYMESPITNQLIVENNRTYPIRILQVDAEKSCTTSLPRGTVVSFPPQGIDQITGLGFDLDSGPESGQIDATEVTIADNKPPAFGSLYFEKNTVSIPGGGQHVFSLTAATLSYSCMFRYVFTILDGKTELNQTIGNGAKPFAVSAFGACYSENYIWDDGGNTLTKEKAGVC